VSEAEASHLVATMLFLFIMRDGRRHLPADRASLGKRAPGFLHHAPKQM
jgi:hypothetical protein